MKSKWQKASLGSVCDVRRGTTITQKEATLGNVPVVAGGIAPTYYHSVANRPAGTITVSASGANAGYVNRYLEPIFASDCSTIIPRDASELVPEFVFRFLQSKQDWISSKLRRGSAQPHVYASDLEQIEILFPDIEEQRRIVAVLDKAFATIAIATANAQNNRGNAQSLFESELRKVFLIDSASWKRRRLSEVAVEFGRGKSRHRPRGDKRLYGTEAPFIQTGDLSNADHWLREYSQMYSKLGVSQSKLWPIGTVCVAIVGATLGESAILAFDACFPDSVIGIVVDTGKANSEFVEYALQYFKSELKEKGKGTARDNINIGTFEGQLFPFPDVAVQRDIVDRLNAISDKARKLSSLTEAKITALSELKQSLLRRAFAGELTAAVTDIAAPTANDNFATPQFTAQVLAFAHRRHERRQKQRTFGHVKAQKTLHLVESIGGIDLGRQPIRDAAGPNDFQHMLSATDWAVRQGFFEFVTRASGNGYDFKKLTNYGACWVEAEAATKPVVAELTRAIDLIVDSPSDFAELIATTHAAWNNLIIDKAAITDHVIVLAARDNWHDSKLKFDPSRFHDAIRFIRTNNIEPDGSAKYVGGQERLL